MSTTCPFEPDYPDKPELGGQVKHADPHTKIMPMGTVVFTCGACGIRMVD